MANILEEVQEQVAAQLSADYRLSACPFLVENRKDIDYEIKNKLSRQGIVGLVMTPKATYAGKYEDQFLAWTLEELEIDIVENVTVNRGKKDGYMTGQDAAMHVFDVLCPLSGDFEGQFSPTSYEEGEDHGLLVSKCLLKALVYGEHGDVPQPEKPISYQFVKLLDQPPPLSVQPHDGWMWETQDGFVLWKDGEAKSLGASMPEVSSYVGSMLSNYLPLSGGDIAGQLGVKGINFSNSPDQFIGIQFPYVNANIMPGVAGIVFQQLEDRTPNTEFMFNWQNYDGNANQVARLKDLSSLDYYLPLSGDANAAPVVNKLLVSSLGSTLSIDDIGAHSSGPMEVRAGRQTYYFNAPHGSQDAVVRAKDISSAWTKEDETLSAMAEVKVSPQFSEDGFGSGAKLDYDGRLTLESELATSTVDCHKLEINGIGVIRMKSKYGDSEQEYDALRLPKTNEDYPIMHTKTIATQEWVLEQLSALLAQLQS